MLQRSLKPLAGLPPVSGAVVLAVALAGCDGSGGSSTGMPTGAPPPAHPAMRAPPTAPIERPTGASFHEGMDLPPGHPPVAGGASERAGAQIGDRAQAGGGAEAGGERRAGNAALPADTVQPNDTVQAGDTTQAVHTAQPGDTAQAVNTVKTKSGTQAETAEAPTAQGVPAESLSASERAPAASASLPAAGTPRAGGLAEKLAQLGLEVKIPSGWKEVLSSSAMRMATVVLEKAEGDARDAELAVSLAGGDDQQNIVRWQGQFQEKPEAATSTREVSGLHVITAEMEGTFRGAGSPQPGTKLWGAIIKVPGLSQSLFLKAWGPRATVEMWKPTFEELLGSLRVRK